MALPKRTLSAGVTTAAAQGKDVYVTEGVFPETLNVTNGVSVYGGYNATWQRSPANTTKITGAASPGDSFAAVASNVTAPTTLQLLTLLPSAPEQPGRQLIRPARHREHRTSARPRHRCRCSR